eukprot:10150422-Heterocapsa_arctica.AAC.1
MASQPSTSSGPTFAESPIAKHMAYPAFAGEMISVESSSAQTSSLMSDQIASSPMVDAISVVSSGSRAS